MRHYHHRIKMSSNVWYNEISCPLTGIHVMLPQMIFLFQSVRAACDFPIPISSGYRSQTYQDELRERLGDRAASISPHTYGAALDIPQAGDISTNDMAVLFKSHATALHYPRPRLGYKKYDGTHLHVDLIFFCFEPYTSIKNPNPTNWKPGVEW